jgi:hypothetical protein
VVVFGTRALHSRAAARRAAPRRNVAPCPRLAFHPDAAVVQLHYFLGDGQAQAGAFGLAGGLVAGLKNLSKMLLVVAGAMPLPLSAR